MKNVIIWGVTLLFIVVLFYWNDKKQPANMDSQEKEILKSEAKWVEAIRFKGNGMKNSKNFELMGGESRIRFAYNGEMAGMFFAYVVPSGHDLNKKGGLPDVMTTNVVEEGESYLQKSAGSYYLHINAVGNWIVTIEELK